MVRRAAGDFAIMIAAVIAGVIAAGSSAARASGAGPYWEHNGSLMVYRAWGQNREFRYEAPKPDLSKRGVGKGTVLFRGTQTGDRIAGTAYTYPGRKGCPRKPYRVDGIITNPTLIVLRGAAPLRIPGTCRSVQTSLSPSATLKFEHLDASLLQSFYGR